MAEWRFGADFKRSSEFRMIEVEPSYPHASRETVSRRCLSEEDCQLNQAFRRVPQHHFRKHYEVSASGSLWFDGFVFSLPVVLSRECIVPQGSLPRSGEIGKALVKDVSSWRTAGQSVAVTCSWLFSDGDRRTFVNLR